MIDYDEFFKLTKKERRVLELGEAILPAARTAISSYYTTKIAWYTFSFFATVFSVVSLLLYYIITVLIHKYQPVYEQLLNSHSFHYLPLIGISISVILVLLLLVSNLNKIFK